MKISKVGKLNSRSWSLEALETCPASKGSDGELVPACKGCYAVGGNYRFQNVKDARSHNKRDWKRSEWVADMIEELDSDRYFRWFDSGDMYSLALAEKMYEICKATPWTKHWIPTRMHKFKKFRDVIDRLNDLDNVVVRLSSDGVNGEIVQEAKYSSTIIPFINSVTVATVCNAPLQEGKCKKCRACWSKDVKVIAYAGHGAKMKKIQREMITLIEVA
tara:strand:+ start:45 stop:698 length:654 start_codon:yes stop_codon:yes gene_type:complete